MAVNYFHNNRTHFTAHTLPALKQPTASPWLLSTWVPLLPNENSLVPIDEDLEDLFEKEQQECQVCSHDQYNHSTIVLNTERMDLLCYVIRECRNHRADKCRFAHIDETFLVGKKTSTNCAETGPVVNSWIVTTYTGHQWRGTRSRRPIRVILPNKCFFQNHPILEIHQYPRVCSRSVLLTVLVMSCDVMCLVMGKSHDINFGSQTSTHILLV